MLHDKRENLIIKLLEYGFDLTVNDNLLIKLLVFANETSCVKILLDSGIELHSSFFSVDELIEIIQLRNSALLKLLLEHKVNFALLNDCLFPDDGLLHLMESQNLSFSSVILAIFQKPILVVSK